MKNIVKVLALVSLLGIMATACHDEPLRCATWAI